MTHLKYDDSGLIVTVAQDRLTGAILMVAWMDRAALERTVETGRATFFSRSRGRLWEKGETSGNTLHVHSLHADCDGDTLLLLVDPVGPACHTGRPSCFFRRWDAGAWVDTPSEAEPFIAVLEREIASRAGASAERSYTRALLDGGAAKIGVKLREEASELAEAIDSEDADRVANEAADLLYHVMVGLRLRGVPWRAVIEVLAGRAGTSGHEEKAARGKSSPSG